MSTKKQRKTQANKEKYCDMHHKLLERLSRIEGENIAIISLLAIIIAAILTKVI
jgi:hypothetical protein